MDRSSGRRRDGGHRRYYGVTVSARRRPGAGERTARSVVAGAVRPGFNRPHAFDRVVPMLARQRIHMARVRRGPDALDLRPWAGRSHCGMARRVRIHDAHHVGRREPGRNDRGRVCRSLSSALRASGCRSRPACGPTDGARRRGIYSANWCATGCATATSRPA